MVTTDRKQQILDVAQELLQSHGYDGFSYSDLSRRLGIAKPSIHHHFATKEDLGLALIEGYREMFEGIQEELRREHPDPADRLRAMMAMKEEDACKEAHQVCPGCALHANMENFPSALREAATRLNDGYHAWLTELLHEGREAGSIHFEGKPEDEAWALSAQFLGARQQARTHGVAVLRAVIRQIENRLLKQG